MYFVFVSILILILFYLNPTICIEKFSGYPIFQSFIPWANGYTNLPWWNTQIGNKSNMSYDLRGDPLVIPLPPYELVWNNPTKFPIYNLPI